MAVACMDGWIFETKIVKNIEVLELDPMRDRRGENLRSTKRENAVNAVMQ